MTTGPAEFQVSGAVTFANLMALRREGEAVIAEAPERAVMDLAGLEDGNSAAVALLMAWLRSAEAHDKPIVFRHVPAGVRNIIELSGLADVLPMEDSEPGATLTQPTGGGIA